jgi:hypothetical protein
LKPDLLDSANKLQNKRPNATFISKPITNVSSFKNSNANKNKVDLQVIAEEDHQQQNTQNSNAAFA